MLSTLFLKYKILIREMILYGIIGGFSASVDSVIFYFLSKNITIYTSNLISIIIGITVSFLLNTYLNFGKKDRLFKRAIRFYTIGYLGLLLSMLILYIGVDINNFKEMNVKILSIFIVAGFQFILNKYITFREIK